MALTEGGYNETELYFEQLTPLVILAETADETGKSISQVEDETNKSMENPATQENPGDQTTQDATPPTKENMEERNKVMMPMSSAFFEREYEIIKK